MADAAVLGTAYTRVNDSTSPAVNITDVPVGSWMVVSLMAASSTATFTAPAGWDVLKTVETTGTRRNQAWGRVKQSGDGNTAAFTSSAVTAMTFVVVWGSGDWDNRVVGASRTRSTVGSSPRSQNIAPSVSATAGAVALAFTHEATSAQVASDEITGVSPSGWTRERWVEQITNYLETIGVYQKPMSGAGATGDLTVTYSSTQDSNGWAFQVAIPETGSATTATGTLAIAGTATATVSLTRTATGTLTVSGTAARSLGVSGFASVAQMLATPGATWAHRGGSANWPEMSQYAYEQAVLAGYGALEFSANRTSDGVWVGCHDASLNRTSQTSGLADISAMTWAQVQTYQNSLNSAGTPRAYYRLDQFLDDFTGTNVAIVDPKYAIGTYNTEFLNLLDAHGGNTKIVVKFYGVGSGATALADAATARGYQTWGYFYDTDVTGGGLAADQSHWSILGMNYDAAQSAWDAVLAYGKPVVGHIAASQANYNTAISRGARMVQVANVSGVTAVGASTIPASGSLTVAGTATRTVQVSRTSSGGLDLSGSTVVAVAVSLMATGSLTLSGIAQVEVEVTRTAVGVLGVAGTTERSLTVTRTALGILTLTGVATPAGSTTVTATGTLGLQGAASFTVQLTRTATGTLTAEGVGVIVTETPDWPDTLTLGATINTLTLEATAPTLTLEAAS